MLLTDLDERVRILEMPESKFENKPISSNIQRTRVNRIFRVKNSANDSNDKAKHQNSEESK